jgi:hypothetical protein
MAAEVAIGAAAMSRAKAIARIMNLLPAVATDAGPMP